MLLIKATIRSAIIRFMQKVARTAADAKKPTLSIQFMQRPRIYSSTPYWSAPPQKRVITRFLQV